MIKNILKSLITPLVVSIIVCIVLISLTSGKEVKTTLGSTIETIRVTFGSGIKVGGSGTNITQIIAGTCNLLNMNSTQAATTTASYDCIAPGVKSGDIIESSLGTTSPNISNLNWIGYATASSTSGYLTWRITNLTGASAIPSVRGVGSSTQYTAFRTVAY